jgi:hypothetical protein
MRGGVQREKNPRDLLLLTTILRPRIGIGKSKRGCGESSREAEHLSTSMPSPGNSDRNPSHLDWEHGLDG